MKRALSCAVVALAATGCDNDTDPRWQLVHDRIIAVRASPAGLRPGETATLDGLVTSADGGPVVQPPTRVVLDGDSASLRRDDAGWAITAPDEATLVARRAALGLADGAPIPETLTATFTIGDRELTATKQILLGTAHANPSVGPVSQDGAPIASTPVVPAATDVVFAIDTAAHHTVRWLTSCGSLDRDDDTHQVILNVGLDDRRAGQLVVVVRDPLGGVAWQIWPLTTAP